MHQFPARFFRDFLLQGVHFVQIDRIPCVIFVEDAQQDDHHDGDQENDDEEGVENGKPVNLRSKRETNLKDIREQKQGNLRMP